MPIRPCPRRVRRRTAFSLIELLVVIAIIAILVSLLTSAVQQARQAAARIQCANNLHQLAIAAHVYYDQTGAMPYGRKYDVWDTYTWTTLLLPYLEQDAEAAGYWTQSQTGYVEQYPGPNGPIGDDPNLRAARMLPVRAFLCPSDPGPVGNELDTAAYGFIRGNYRGCVGSGDVYGQAVDGTTGPWGVGMFGVSPGQSIDPQAPVPTVGVGLEAVSDGTSNTLLFSEGVVCRFEGGWGGPLGEILYGNMGGALFSANLTPNSTAADRVIGPCPQDVGDNQYSAPCLSLGGSAWWTPSAAGAHAAARSRHPTGVNAALADGSVRYFSNKIDQSVWRALGTRAGGEPNGAP